MLPAPRVPGPGHQHGGQGVLADPRAQALAHGTAGEAPLPPLRNHARRWAENTGHVFLDTLQGDIELYMPTGINIIIIMGSLWRPIS